MDIEEALYKEAEDLLQTAQIALDHVAGLHDKVSLLFPYGRVGGGEIR